MFSGSRKYLFPALVLYFLFFFGITKVGLLGPDEPRYASIGRQMARSGDWVTPRLWGEAWFEKPALLYWMTASGFRLGLGDELAPRLPVVLVSVAFLIFYQRRLREEFGGRAGWYAAAILATSAAWLSFSHIAVTDLPMAAAFSTAMLLGLPWLASGDRRGLLPAGVFLGLAVLAKGLVPLVLALPLLWIGRRRWKDLLAPAAVAFAVAAPWYVLCASRNGPRFLEDFFLRHHFQRFSTEALQHVQPFWFYVPVLLAALFPWTPMLALLAQRKIYQDLRLRFLLAWTGFGFLFFSAATNKLPGYLLPLIPPLCALGGVALAQSRTAPGVLAAAAALLALGPFASSLLPQALASGISRATPDGWALAAGLPVLLLAVLCWRWERDGRRDRAVGAIVLAVAAGAALLKWNVFPKLDETVSARTLWRQVSHLSTEVCIEDIHRSWRYGLNYYSIEPLPDCESSDRPLRIVQEPRRPPRLQKRR